MIDWHHEVRMAGSRVEAWIQRIDDAGWTGPPEATWNNKDLLGHLAAWSTLLIDQLEAFTQSMPRGPAAVDVDVWNAEQVAKRRSLSAADIIDEWRASFRRALVAVESLPADAYRRRSEVAWASRPASIEDVLRLWVAHVQQHRARLEA